MSMMVQMGPPGSEGAPMVGIGGSVPPPENLPPIHRQQSEAIVMTADIDVMRRYKSLAELAPDSPAMKMLTDTVALVVDLFKLSMASMLSVFVPQLCPASEVTYKPSATGTTAGDYVGPAIASFSDNWDGCTRETVPHDCTFEENFICLSPLNQFVLSWNFICLGVLVFHYFLVWRREHFLIANFKESLTLGRLHVRDVISDYPTVRARLHKYNRWVFNTSIIAIVLQIVNVISSGILVFGYYSNGYKSFTTFFTNILLISLILYNCMSAAYVGLKHELAYSCVAFEPVSYNAVSADCIKGK